MIQHVTAVLMGLLFTFWWIQFKEINSICPHGRRYLLASDVLIVFLLNAVFTVASWNILTLIPLVIL